MPKVEKPINTLAEFLPDESFEAVIQYIHHYKVHLIVTQKRKTILGNYRHKGFNSHHTITVNGNLNKYEFLITLLHELAHLLTFEQFGNKVEAHGKEWKYFYSKLLIDFVNKKVFPDEIKKALQKSILNPSATANGETELLRVLRKHNSNFNNNVVFLENIPHHALFITEKNRVFKKGIKRRTRFECVEISSNKTYLFNPLAEVKLFNE